MHRRYYTFPVSSAYAGAPPSLFLVTIPPVGELSTFARLKVFQNLKPPLDLPPSFQTLKSSGKPLICSQQRRWPAASESDIERVRDGSGKMAGSPVLAPALTRFDFSG